MIQDLLALADHEPPMGDLFTRRRIDAGRSVWTAPLPGERNVPKTRIVHQRVVRLHGGAILHRLGVRRGQGYHKCGSRQDLDWVAALRVLALQGETWRELWRNDAMRAPAPGQVDWIALPSAPVAGVILEIRQSGIDGGWSPWPLAMSAFVLEGELLAPLAPRRERLLSIAPVELRGLPRGVSAWCRDGEVRYRTATYEIGFTLNRPGCSFLGLQLEEPRRPATNLLHTQPPLFHQGPQLHEAGGAPGVAPSVRCDLEGTCRVRGGTVAYDFTVGSQRYQLVWRVGPAGLTLRVVRESARAIWAWHSAAWVFGLRNSASPAHVLGSLVQQGETGGVDLPALLIFPGFGSWEVSSPSRGTALRSECVRHLDLNLLELKVGEERSADGLYRLPAGRFAASFRLRPVRPPARLRPGAPRVAQRAVARTQWTALTFRPDTGTLSNNGASIHCPICMDTWAAVTLALGDVRAGWPAVELLRVSLERWLDGGPGYAAGRLLQDGKAHEADDEYLMTGAAALRGLGDYLRHAASARWWREYAAPIRARLRAARARDLDDDGLIESAYRTGVSGTSQWSTCWFDVISFGWKDAFANAILYGALGELAVGLRRFGATAEAEDLVAWRRRLHASYRRTFWNEATGWLAGWRCRENRLHDYAFLPVNGAAVCAGLVDAAEGRALLQRLLSESKSVGCPDAALGLPGNLRHIPDEDLADIMQGYPLGYYQNGGRTHAQARHFVMALYRCGLRSEADRLLRRLCVGLAEARVFGGNQSGVDWRHWDDRPCGYEGLLTDQFGVLEPILWRWGRRSRANARRT